MPSAGAAAPALGAPGRELAAGRGGSKRSPVGPRWAKGRSRGGAAAGFQQLQLHLHLVPCAGIYGSAHICRTPHRDVLHDERF